MPRYLVERTFVDGLHIPINDAGAATVAGVVATNAEHGVTWVHSYVSADHAKTFCVYDGPSPEAIRQVAERNGLPVDVITEVRVLDPYFYADQGAKADAA
jgi:Nickel responsive protein SCO4226-like